MGNLTDSERPKPPQQAYTRLRRIKNAMRFIKSMATNGRLEITQSRFVAITYGLDASLIKRIKARYRNELSFSPEGK